MWQNVNLQGDTTTLLFKPMGHQASIIYRQESKKTPILRLSGFNIFKLHTLRWGFSESAVLFNKQWTLSQHGVFQYVTFAYNALPTDLLVTSILNSLLDFLILPSHTKICHPTVHGTECKNFSTTLTPGNSDKRYFLIVQIIKPRPPEPDKYFIVPRMPFLPRPHFNPSELVSEHLNWHPTRSLSWNAAQGWCQEYGAHLPTFSSVEEVEQLLALMKYTDVPHIEALFIGLKFERFSATNRVSFLHGANLRGVSMCWKTFVVV